MSQINSKYFFNFIVYTLCLIVFSSCTSKQLEPQSKRIVLTIKSKNIKYNDVALMKKSPSVIQLDGFFAGVSMFRLRVAKNICMNKKCLTPKLFNTQFLSPFYKDEILKNILTKKPIFDNKNMKKNKNGFTQTIHNRYYNISYKVTNENVYFKDKTNKILIKTKELNI